MMDSSNLDLSKLVSIILENPELISAIKSLAASSEKKNEDEIVPEDTAVIAEEHKEEAHSDGENTDTEATVASADAESVPTYKSSSSAIKSERRATLLQALKPYVSNERAKAIDTMMSFAEVFKLMREG